MNPKELAHTIAELAADGKAEDIAILDLRGLASFTDYFLICSGRSERQARAIHDRIHLGIKERCALLPTRVEGLEQSSWVLMDYGDVIVHVFTPEVREHYRLEQLWGEAPSERFEDEPVVA